MPPNRRLAEILNKSYILRDRACKYYVGTMTAGKIHDLYSDDEYSVDLTDGYHVLRVAFEGGATGEQKVKQGEKTSKKQLMIGTSSIPELTSRYGRRYACLQPWV